MIPKDTEQSVDNKRKSWLQVIFEYQNVNGFNSNSSLYKQL